MARSVNCLLYFLFSVATHDPLWYYDSNNIHGGVAWDTVVILLVFLIPQIMRQGTPKKGADASVVLEDA